MDKYIGVCCKSGKIVYVFVQVDERDYDVCMKRLEAFKKRWEENVMETYNNGSPMMTRDYDFCESLEYAVGGGVLKCDDAGKIDIGILDSWEIEEEDEDSAEYVNFAHLTAKNFY